MVYRTTASAGGLGPGVMGPTAHRCTRPGPPARRTRNGFFGGPFFFRRIVFDVRIQKNSTPADARRPGLCAGQMPFTLERTKKAKGANGRSRGARRGGGGLAGASAVARPSRGPARAVSRALPRPRCRCGGSGLELTASWPTTRP